MSLPGELRRRVGMLLRRARVDRELAEEMQTHLELRERRLRDEGQEAEAARDAARRRFGNATRLREEGIDAWGWRWLEQLGQDLRFGWRTLRKQPVFSMAAVSTLALAIGATTAIFSVVNGVLLRPLPFDDPDRLVQVYGRAWRGDRGGAPDPLDGPIAMSELDVYAAESASFVGFAGYAVQARHADAGTSVERLNAVVADGTLFDLLGVEPIAGRTFSGTDEGSAVVISERLWERRFGRSPEALGSRITLDDRSFTLVGVMPERFQFPYRAASLLPGAAPEARTDVWVPFEPPPGVPGAAGRGRVSVVARLKPGVPADTAEAELRVIAARIEERYRGTETRVGVRLEPLTDAVLGPVRSSLWLLFGAVGLVLLTACANVANLLLARMTVRTREVVTRAALGAGRLRLIRQFLAEGLLLALGGSLAGIVLARWGTDLLVTLYTGRIPRAHEVALDWQVFVFLLLACAGTAVLFGLPPAFTAARVDPHAVTKESTGQLTPGRRVGRMRDALATVEIALAFALGVGALLVVREMIRLQQVDSGMETGNVAVLHVTPRAPAADYYAIEARAAALPGVEAAGFIQLVPLQNWGWEADFDIRGRAPDPGVRRTTGLRYVTPGYFRALGIPIVKGRGFTAGDVEGAPRVVLVNEALVRRYFSGEDAVGRELDRGTIAGIVGDVRNVRLDRPAEPEIYYPAAQNVTMTSDLGMSLVIRATGDPGLLMPAVRRAVLDVNPTLAIFDIKTMEQIVDESLWELRLYRWLIGLFAALALVLAAIGLYGVVSYSAAARTREFAIRLALGSGHRPLAGLVMRHALLLTGAGLVCGVMTVLLLTWMAGDVQNLRPDASTCAAVGAVLFAITLGACTVPALRARSIDLVGVLRSE